MIIWGRIRVEQMWLKEKRIPRIWCGSNKGWSRINMKTKSPRLGPKYPRFRRYWSTPIRLTRRTPDHHSPPTEILFNVYVLSIPGRIRGPLRISHLGSCSRSTEGPFRRVCVRIRETETHSLVRESPEDYRGRHGRSGGKFQQGRSLCSRGVGGRKWDKRSIVKVTDCTRHNHKVNQRIIDRNGVLAVENSLKPRCHIPRTLLRTEYQYEIFRNDVFFCSGCRWRV